MGTLEIDARSGLPQKVADAISRYRHTHRKRLRKLAKLSDAHADIITTCPVAAIALITEHGTVAMRAAAVDRLKSGAPLKSVLDALKLPHWLRKLPPRVFAVSLASEWFSPEGNMKLAGLVPADEDGATGWFRYVVKANQVGGERFALWLAAQNVRWAEARLDKARELRALAAFAWYSLNRDLPAGLLIERPWHPKIGFIKALDAAYVWLDAIADQVLLTDGAVTDTWLAGGRVNGYRFVPLLSAAELKDEAKAMDHCVDQYGECILAERCRIFGIRWGSRHVATLEIQPHHAHPGRPMIVQLRGRGNCEVPEEIWRAVFLWLAKQKAYKLPDEPGGQLAAPCAKAWSRLFRAYWLVYGSDKVLPAEPQPDTLGMLRLALNDLRVLG